MNGVLVMHKPQGFTSFDVIGKLRGILHMKRLGHTGTLDPMAEGVLPVLVGTATRAADILPVEDKTYRASFRLGLTTDTQDITGQVVTQQQPHVNEGTLREVLSRFVGEISQIPPMYSAVKVDGKRLYQLAREGKEIQRPARLVRVDSIDLLSFHEESGSGEVEVRCGKGTYIRTLLHDLGQALGCGCCMTALLRTECCGFTLQQAHHFDEVQAAADQGQIEKLLIPTDTLFETLPKLKLGANESRLYRNGVKLPLNQLDGVRADTKSYRIYDSEDVFLGLAAADFENNLLRVRKNL